MNEQARLNELGFFVPGAGREPPLAVHCRLSIFNIWGKQQTSINGKILQKPF
jgi:hypothetical protein